MPTSGISSANFDMIFYSSVAVGVIGIGLTCFLAAKRGVDITTRKFGLKTAITWLLFCGIPVVWATDMRFEIKALGSGLALLAAFANYFLIESLQKNLSNKE
jgi:hypothetical protein